MSGRKLSGPGRAGPKKRSSRAKKVPTNLKLSGLARKCLEFSGEWKMEIIRKERKLSEKAHHYVVAVLIVASLLVGNVPISSTFKK